MLRISPNFFNHSSLVGLLDLFQCLVMMKKKVVNVHILIYLIACDYFLRTYRSGIIMSKNSNIFRHLIHVSTCVCA